MTTHAPTYGLSTVAVPPTGTLVKEALAGGKFLYIVDSVNDIPAGDFRLSVEEARALLVGPLWFDYTGIDLDERLTMGEALRKADEEACLRGKEIVMRHYQTIVVTNLPAELAIWQQAIDFMLIGSPTGAYSTLPDPVTSGVSPELIQYVQDYLGMYLTRTGQI